MGKIFNMFLRFIFFLTIFFHLSARAQDNLSALTIPEALSENANAVVRLSQKDIVISSQRMMTIKETRIVTVLNAKGDRFMGASEYFDDSSRIKAIEAVIYDSTGKEIKKIKRKDFKERPVNGGAIITDNKVLYLDYTPGEYPFTIVYTCELETPNTAFLPQWHPLENYYGSTQKSVITIKYPQGLGFKYKEYNCAGIQVRKEEKANCISLSAENLPACKEESYSPSLDKTSPYVLFGLEKFHLEGVDGTATDWKSFGSWMYSSLLSGTEELNPDTVSKIKALVGNEKDIVKKAKIVYNYVQNKTRYISIQLGIGGWKPMLAKDVERLGYGDCKALSNYTRALLKAVDIDSYYALVYGDSDKKDIKADFVSMQGNHAILAIPVDKDLVWLECTSQVHPFGFQGTFTDDRDILIVKPDGGEIVRSHIYTVKENSQIATGTYTIVDNGSISGNINRISKGTQYDEKFAMEFKDKDGIADFYRSGFRSITNLKLKKTSFQNNKEKQEFTENVSVEADGYCSKNGSQIIFAVNAFNQYSSVPQRYRNRKNSFEIARGFYDTDEVTINLPAGYTVETLPENVSIKDAFGDYTTEYKLIAPGQMLYKRKLLIKDGLYESKDYETYRQFIDKIARNDNAKVVLVKA